MTLEWDDVATGTRLGPHRMPLSAAANERYWRAAGLDHPALASDHRQGGLAYPMIAANATVLAWLDTCPTPMIQTRQRLTCRQALATPATLETRGSVVARFERRGRDYVTIRVEVASDAGSGTCWISEVDFTPAATIAANAPNRSGARTDRNEHNEHAARTPHPAHAGARRRSLTISDELIRQYSRRGNYHSDPDTARQLGLPGLVAQGTQVCGPAYAILLDTWGTSFVAHGTLETRFVGMVLGGDTVEAEVHVGDRDATFTVHNRSRDRLAVIGRATRVTTR
jgi:acyl dehydratase